MGNGFDFALALMIAPLAIGGGIVMIVFRKRIQRFSWIEIIRPFAQKHGFYDRVQFRDSVLTVVFGIVLLAMGLSALGRILWYLLD